MNNDRCVVDELGNLFVLDLSLSGNLVLRMYPPSSSTEFASTALDSLALTPHISYDPLEGKVYTVFVRDGLGFDEGLQKNIQRQFIISRYTPPTEETTDWQPDWRVTKNFLGLEDGKYPKLSLPLNATATSRQEFLIAYVATDVLEYFIADGVLTQEPTITMKFLYMSSSDGEFISTIDTGLVITDESSFVALTDQADVFIGGIYDSTNNYIRVAKYNGITFGRAWVLEHNPRNNSQDDTNVKTNLRILKFGVNTFVSYNSGPSNYVIWRVSNRGLRVWPRSPLPPGQTNPPPISTSDMLGGTVQNIYLFQDTLLLAYLSTGSSPRKVTFKKVSSETGFELSSRSSVISPSMSDIQTGTGNSHIVSGFPWDTLRVVYKTPIDTVKVETFSKAIYRPPAPSSVSEITQDQIAENPEFTRSFITYKDDDGVHVSSVRTEEGSLVRTDLISPIPNSSTHRFPVISYFNNNVYVTSVDVCVSFTDFMKMYVTRISEGVYIGRNKVFVFNRPENFTTTGIRNMFPAAVNGTIIRDEIEGVELRSSFTQPDIVTFPTEELASLAAGAIDNQQFSGSRVRARIGDPEFVTNWTVERIVPDTFNLRFRPKIQALSSRVFVFYTREDKTVNLEWINSAGVYLRTITIKRSGGGNMLIEDPSSLSLWITPTLPTVGPFSQNILIGGTISGDANRFRVVRYTFHDIKYVSDVVLDFGVPSELKDNFFLRETNNYDGEFYAICQRPDHQVLVSFVSIPDKQSVEKAYQVEFSVPSQLTNMLSNRILGAFSCFDNLVLFAVDATTRNILSAKITTNGVVFLQSREDVSGLSQLVPLNGNISSGCILSFGDFTKYFLFGRIDSTSPVLPRQQRYQLVSEVQPVFQWSVSSNLSSYLFSDYSSGSNISIRVEQGAILIFDVNTFGNPLWIKTEPVIGTGSAVTIGVTNNGISQGILTWETSDVPPGTYYYISQTHVELSGTIIIDSPPPQPVVYGVLYNEIETIFLESSLVEVSEYQNAFDPVERRNYFVGRMNPTEIIGDNRLAEAVFDLTNFLLGLDTDDSNVFPKTSSDGTIVQMRNKMIELFTEFGEEFIGDLLEVFDFMLEESSDVSSERSINFIDFVVSNFTIPFSSVNLIENDDDNFTIRVPFADYTEEKFIALLRNRCNKISRRRYQVEYTPGNPIRWTYEKPLMRRTPGLVSESLRTLDPSIPLQQVINDLRTISVSRLIADHPFDLPVYTGVLESTDLTEIYELSLGVNISFTVNWADLTLLPTTLTTLYETNPQITEADKPEFEEYVRERIRIRRMIYLADELKVQLDDFHTKISPMGIPRRYSYTIDEENILQWSYEILEQSFLTPRSTQNALDTFLNSSNFLITVLERMRNKLNSDQTVTTSIFSYDYVNDETDPGYRWSVREISQTLSGGPYTTQAAVWRVSNNDVAVVSNKYDELKLIVDNATGFTYTFTAPTNPGTTILWNGPGIVNSNTDFLLLNIPYKNRTREVALLDVRSAVLTGLVDPLTGLQTIYNYSLSRLIDGFLEWTEQLIPFQSILVGDADAMLARLSPDGREEMIRFIKETLDEFTRHVYTRVISTTTWTYVIPTSLPISVGSTELALSSLPGEGLITYDLQGVSITDTLWNFLKDRLSETSPLRIYGYYDFDERNFDSVVPLYRRWYYDTIEPFVPENTRFLFAGPDPNTLEIAMGLPTKILNLSGNYSISFNSIESKVAVPADLTGIVDTVLTMRLIEDFGTPLDISVAKVNDRTIFLDNLQTQLNNLSLNKVYSYQVIDDKIRWTFVDKDGESPLIGNGAVAFEFTLGSSMGVVLGFPSTNVNELVYSFDLILFPNEVDVTPLGRTAPVQDPVGLYLKAFDERGFQVFTPGPDGLEPLQSLLSINGHNACVCQDEENVYVCYVVGRKTLSAFTTFHVSRYFKSSFIQVWEQTFVLPDANINILFPRLVPVKNEVHLFYGRNDDRIYVRVYESLSGLQRGGKVCDLGIKMCVQDKREMKVVRSLQSLDDQFFMYIAFPDGTSPVGGKITIGKYFSGNYSTNPTTGYWRKHFAVGASVKSNIVIKEDPITKDIFLSYTNTLSGISTVNVLCITSSGDTIRYSIDGLEGFTDLVRNRILGMFVFDECLLFFGLTTDGSIIGFKARTTTGTRVGDVKVTALGYDTSNVQAHPFFSNMESPWDKIVLGYVTLVQGELFLQQTLKIDILESLGQGGITVTDTEVSQFQAHLDPEDNIYSLTYVGGIQGLNLTKFDPNGNPVVQRNLSGSGQSPAISGNGPGTVYVAYTLSVDSFIKYLGVYVAKLRTSNLTDIWNYTRLYEEDLPTPFRPRIRVRDDRVFTVYTNESSDIFIQINRASTGQLVKIINTGINMGLVDPTELVIELQNDRLIYLAYPNGPTSIRLVKYNTDGTGSIVWQNQNFEGHIPGAKTALILRYNQQLQNDFISFDYNLDSVLSKGEMRDYLTAVGIDDRTDEIWELFMLSDTEGLVYDQFAEYMYSESFRFENRNGLYINYTAGEDEIRLTKIDQLGGGINWSVNTNMSFAYGGRAHAFYITNNVPLLMAVDDSTADLVAKKFEPVEGAVLSIRSRHLVTFDKVLFLNYPHIFSRDFWDCIWLVYPHPSEYYDNWVTLVNKLVAPAIPDPSETFVKLSDKQAMNDCDDCLYVTYVTEEGPNNVTLSKLTYDGVTQFVKALDVGGQSPSVHVVGNKAVVAYVKRLVTFTDIIGLYVRCVDTSTFETIWLTERLLNDSVVDSFKPRVQKSDKGIHLAYFRQDGFLYIDTYNIESGLLIGEPLLVPEFKLPNTNDLSVIREYVDELDTHSTACFYYAAIPDEISGTSIKLAKFDALTMADPGGTASKQLITTNTGTETLKTAISIETSKGDLYQAVESLHVGFTDDGSVVKAMKIGESFEDPSSIEWVSLADIVMDNVYLKRLHAMYVEGEFTLLFFVQKQTLNIQVTTVKFDPFGNQLETKTTDGPPNRTIVYTAEDYLRISEGDTVIETTMPMEDPNTLLILDYGVDPDSIQGYPFVIARAPWDFVFVEYYSDSRIQALQVGFNKRLSIVGLESNGQTRNGLETPFTYELTSPVSEVSSYQMVATQESDTFLAYNDPSGLKLMKMAPDGTRSTILIDEFGQSPSITCFQKVEETEVYEAIMVSYVRKQTGFTTMTVRVNTQVRADTMTCIQTENCATSEYYYLDVDTSIFRPRVDTSLDKVYVLYKRQDERLYIEKLNRENNQYELIRQIREDFSTVDPIDLQIRAFDVNFSILYPMGVQTFLRRFDVSLEQQWAVEFELTQKTRIDEEEDGIFLAYKDLASVFQVRRVDKETGDTDWTTPLTLPPIKGGQIHSLFVLFGYPLVFNTSVDADMVVSKLLPTGAVISQRLSALPLLDTDDIIDCPVILSAPPHKTVTLGYYTTQTGLDIIPASEGLGIVVQTYNTITDFQLPIPKAELTTNQVIQLDSEVLHVHTDEPHRLLITRHRIEDGSIVSSRLISDDGYPFRAIIKMSEDKLYLSYIKYEINYTEIVEVVLVELDPMTLDILRGPVRRALPDPEPGTFRPRIFIVNNELVRLYVRYDNKINIERLNLSNLFLTRPQPLGIVYDDRDPENIHFHREGSQILFIYPTNSTEDTYRVSKINPQTFLPIWTVDMNVGFAGVPKIHPDLRFDMGHYYMSMSSASRGHLTKFSDQNGSVVWNRDFEVSGYSFSGYSVGDNIDIVVLKGTKIVFNVDIIGSPLLFKSRRITGPGFALGSDVVTPEQVNTEGVIVVPDQGEIEFDTIEVEPGVYFYISTTDDKMSGKITVLENPSPGPYETRTWTVTKSTFVPTRFNQGMTIFENFPMIFTIPGHNSMMVTKFSDEGVEVSHRITLLDGFQYNADVPQGGSAYSASIYPWRKMLVFHDTNQTPDLSYDTERERSARTFDSGVTDIIAPVTANIRRSQGAQDSRKTAVVTFYQVDPPVGSTGTTVYFFQGRRPLDLCRRLILPTAFQPALSRINGEDTFFLTHARAIETFTEVQFIGMREITADVVLDDVWVLEEQRFPDGRWEHFRPLIKTYEEINALVYVRQNGKLVIETRNKTDGSLRQRLTTTHIVPNPEELVIGGDFELMVGFPNGDDKITLLYFRISDLRQGIREIWPTPLITNFGVPFLEKRSLEVIQNVLENLVVAFLAYDPDNNEQILYVSTIDQDSQEILWTVWAKTSLFSGRFNPNERIAGLTFDGSFVGVTRIGPFLVDSLEETLDAFTYSINNTGSRVREIQDRFESNLPPGNGVQGTPLFMLDMADEFGIMAAIITGGEIKMYRVFSTGGSVRVPFDGDGRALHPTYRDENWWRPFITITPTLQGSSLSQDVILNVKDANWSSVIWTGNNFVAVGPSTELERVMVSSTGRSWTGVELDSEFDKNWVSMVWAQGALNLEPFAIAALSETEDGTSVMTSTDAINWILQDTPGHDVSWSSLVWDSQLFVAVGYAGSGPRVMVSGLKAFGEGPKIDSTAIAGVDWSIEEIELAGDLNTGEWRSVAWSPRRLKKFVAVSSGGPRIMTSVDGCNWLPASGTLDPLIETTSWVNVIWATTSGNGDGYYVAVSPEEGRIAISADGESWSVRTCPLEGTRSIAWARSLNTFAIVSNSGTERFATSIDLRHWTPRATAAEKNIFTTLASELVPEETTELTVQQMRRVLRELHFNLYEPRTTNTGQASYISTDIDSFELPYMSYRDESIGGGLNVRKFNGNSWIPLGSTISAGAVEYVSMKIDNSNRVVVAYRDNAFSGRLTVRRYNGSSWSTLGTMGITTDGVSWVTLVVDQSNKVFVAFSDQSNDGRITVLEYVSPSWVVRGTVGFSTGAVSHISMAVDVDNRLFVAYVDESIFNKIVVKRYSADTDNWLTSFSSGSGVSGEDSSLVNLIITPKLDENAVVIGSSFYLVYRELVTGTSSYTVIAKRYEDELGMFVNTHNSPFVFSDDVLELKVVGDPSGNLFVAVKEPFSVGVMGENTFSEGLSIYTYHPNSNWSLVDRRGFTPGKVASIAITATSNSPDDISDYTRVFIAFSDDTRAGKATMIAFYPLALRTIIISIENMIRDAIPPNADTISYEDFAEDNYNTPQNDWSSIIWSTGAIGPSETGSFMAVSRSSTLDNNIIVYNLPIDLPDRELRDLFTDESYGSITYFRIFQQRATGEPLGFGIVRFSTIEGAENAAKDVIDGGKNGALVGGNVITIERGTPDRAIQSTTGIAWKPSKTIRDVGAGSWKGWFANGHLKFEKRYAIEGEITGFERTYSNNGQWNKEIGHVGISKIREFNMPIRMNLYELFRRFFVGTSSSEIGPDDEVMTKEDLLCGIRSFNLNIPRIPEGSSPLDILFQRMKPDENGLVRYEGFARVVATDVYTRDIVTKIGFDRAILVKDSQSFDGLKDGITTEYESSLPAFMEIRTAIYVKDVLNGPEFTYYSDSSLKSEVVYVNGLREGIYREYFPREFGILKPKFIILYENGYETQFRTNFYPVVAAEPVVELRAESFEDARNPLIKVRMETFWKTEPTDPFLIHGGNANRYANNWVDLIDEGVTTRVTIPDGEYTVPDIFEAVKTQLNQVSVKQFDYSFDSLSLRATWTHALSGEVSFRFSPQINESLSTVLGFDVSVQEFTFAFDEGSLSGPLSVINVSQIRLRTRCFLTDRRAKVGIFEEYARDGSLLQRGVYSDNQKIGRWETIFEKPRTFIVKGAKRVVENFVRGRLSGPFAIQIFNVNGVRIFFRNYPTLI
jgi:antitoxin component YwqK of YwqJK toxin-antitoxin module